MYIAMNRFRINLGKGADFEEIWRTRDTHLKDVPGFLSFNLIKGKPTEEYILYASHTTWQSEQDFLNWTKSESFRAAHKNAGTHSDLYLGHPEFEGFKVVL
ncbi:MAG: antibiotic biosynthesis monooxygenase [Pseudomonadota bacterium]|nr:antibiotic biosynthesis monooxygenase [Pseudomonadota bacterium]